MAQDEAAAAPDELAAGLEHLGVGVPARPERLRVVVVQRGFVRCAEQVSEVDRLVLVVHDRRLDGPVEELLGMAAEELVERVLAGDVDGEAAAAAARATPHLAQRRDRAGERHDDACIECTDVDAELERVGRDDRQQLAAHQPALDLTPLRGV